jgi:hypothetical protein
MASRTDDAPNGQPNRFSFHIETNEKTTRARAEEFALRMLWNSSMESSKAVEQGQVDALSAATHDSVLLNNFEYVLL